MPFIQASQSAVYEKGCVRETVINQLTDKGKISQRTMKMIKFKSPALLRMTHLRRKQVKGMKAKLETQPKSLAT